MMCDRTGVYILGLTGGIASGKSTVSSVLGELGAVIVDADAIAREITAPGSPGERQVLAAFGSGVLSPDGSLSRRALGSIVFRDPAKKALLESIVHPLIFDRIREEFETLRRKDCAIIGVLDAPLLFETGADRMVHEVWVVWVDAPTQVRRLMDRDGHTFEEATLRIRSQMPLEEKVKRAQVVIDNTGSIAETRMRVKELWRTLTKRVCPKGEVL